MGSAIGKLPAEDVRSSSRVEWANAAVDAGDSTARGGVADSHNRVADVVEARLRDGSRQAPWSVA